LSENQAHYSMLLVRTANCRFRLILIYYSCLTRVDRRVIRNSTDFFALLRLLLWLYCLFVNAFHLNSNQKRRSLLRRSCSCRFHRGRDRCRKGT